MMDEPEFYDDPLDELADDDDLVDGLWDEESSDDEDD